LFFVVANTILILGDRTGACHQQANFCQLPSCQHPQARPQRIDLKAQQAAIAAFPQPIDKLLARPFIEVESGKNSDRPQLRAAMERCRKTGVTLLIARLDRLARAC
jgi:hypothetical protein